jgi:hypothetical protein
MFTHKLKSSVSPLLWRGVRGEVSIRQIDLTPLNLTSRPPLQRRGGDLLRKLFSLLSIDQVVNYKVDKVGLGSNLSRLTLNG